MRLIDQYDANQVIPEDESRNEDSHNSTIILETCNEHINE
jgi:hypothetical protein